MGRPRCVWMLVPHARGCQRASSNKKLLNNGADWVMCPGDTGQPLCAAGTGLEVCDLEGNSRMADVETRQRPQRTGSLPLTLI